MISYRQVQPGDVIFVIFRQKISSLVTKLQNILGGGGPTLKKSIKV